MVSPVIEQLARELAGKVVFGKVNLDENPTVAGAFGIQSIPTIAILKNGKAIDGFVGAASKSQMEAKIMTHLEIGNSNMSNVEISFERQLSVLSKGINDSLFIGDSNS
jgi:thioredoxin-like negative regulator of GroEL